MQPNQPEYTPQPAPTEPTAFVPGTPDQGAFVPGVESPAAFTAAPAEPAQFTPTPQPTFAPQPVPATEVFAQPVAPQPAVAPVAVTGGKNFVVALVLSFFLGTIGVDRFYLGHMRLGMAKLLTLGGFGVWSLIDFILIATKHMPGVTWQQTTQQ